MLPGMIHGSPAMWLVQTIGEAWREAPPGMSGPDLIVVMATAVGERLDRATKEEASDAAR